MNLNYIEWYVVELGRQLSSGVPLERRNSLLYETKNHLTSLVEEFQAQGMDQKESQIAAIDRFGTPEKIAAQFVDSFQTKGRFLVGVLNILLFSAITLIVLYLMVSPTELVHNGVAMTIIPMALTFGIYSLLRGKRPSAKWLLLPTAMSFAIGVPAAYFLTSYRSGADYRENVMPYGGLRKQVLSVRAEMAVRDKAVRPYVDFYKTTLKDPKYADGLKSGQTVSVQSYKCIKGSKGIYVSFLPPYKKTMYTARDPYRVDVHGSEFSIGAIADRKPEVLAGPMSGKAFRDYFAERLASEARGRSMDAAALGQLEAALNLSVFERVKLFAWWVATATLLFGVPAAWLASLLAVAIRNLFRFKSRKLGLA